MQANHKKIYHKGKIGDTIIITPKNVKINYKILPHL